MNNIPIKLADSYKQAYAKYGWESGIEGFCIEYNLLGIAEMANKNIEFLVKRRRTKYLISPTKAKEVAKEWNSFFTRRSDGKLIVVIPQFVCEKIKI